MSTSDLPTLSRAGNQDARPLPLIVAAKWGFPPAYVEAEGDIFYAVQDWIRGLTGTEDIRKIWSFMQRNESLFQMSSSTRPLPYVASDGKTYQRDFIHDKGLYLIAQNLRSTKSRPALAAIKQFLAEAGAFVDALRHDPKWLSERLEGKVKRNLFVSTLTAACVISLTRWHYGTATDDIYKGIWGRTAAYLRAELQLPPKANLRDHQPRTALHYQGIAEEAAAHRLGNRQELTWQEAREIVKTVASMVGRQAKEMSDFLELDLATGIPQLQNGTRLL